MLQKIPLQDSNFDTEGLRTLFFYKYLYIKKEKSKIERITSHQVVDLMEAYTAVHAPQINEEQVWEEVESWVNSLLEEGYDLSEYTWEEMYDAYLDEAIGQPGSAGMVNWQDRNSGQVKSGYKSSSDGKLYKNYNDALAAKNSRMGALGLQQGFQRTYTAGGGDAAVAGSPSRPAQGPLAVMAQGATNLQRQQQRPAQAPAPVATRPATAPARPATAPVRPTAAKPPAPTTTPARNGFGASTAPAAAQSSVSSATAPAPVKKPSISSDIDSIRNMRKQSQQRIMSQGGTPATSLVQSFDPFDVVFGHLIDEGYADTEEAALQIMANMSEEWRESIVEGYKKFPTKKVMDKAGKLMGSSAGKEDPKSKKKEKRGIKMMDTMMQHTPDY